MNVIQTVLPGAVIIEPRVFGDARGFFVETYQDKRYKEAGISLDFVQDNHSRSSYGVLRGLHFQKTRPQGKLVRVTSGRVWDVAADINPASPTFRQWVGVELTGENQRQFYVPPGYAHGFVVLSDTADFLYKVTDYYDPQDEGSVAWNDPDLNIDWHIVEPKLSAKDAAAPTLQQLTA